MKLKYLKSLLLLPLLAAMGCPSQNLGACRAGLTDSKVQKWEHKQDVKWARFQRDMKHRFESNS